MAQFDSGSETRKTSVDARITYGKAPPAGEKSYNYLYELPKGQTQRTNFETEEFTFPVTDVRSVQPFTLKGNGFQLEKLDQPGDVQWDVEEQVPHSSLFQYPACCHLVTDICIYIAIYTYFGSANLHQMLIWRVLH